MSNAGELTALRFHYKLPFSAQKAAKDKLLRRLHVETTCHIEVSTPSSHHGIKTFEQKHKEAAESTLRMGLKCILRNLDSAMDPGSENVNSKAESYQWTKMR
ncbi:hypothetical protein CRENBAI_010405 [Crenichthys baileyi]|uniref:Uncharacterized protein n=1 Tax=Crenichthys baileyi TaxID=28760 RepID=A0AAV9QTD2_9TELE